MRLFIPIMALFLVFLLAPVSSQAQTEISTKKFDRSIVSKIKIVSIHENQICFYVTGIDDKVYRIASLTQAEADQILMRFKEDRSIIFNTVPVKNQKYLNVVAWE